jgi:predicted RNA-binding protein with PUA-like domain
MANPPATWLIKTEPVKYSWADLVRDGETVWDGVRNNQAALYLKAMAVGDECFVYHSNEGLEVVGIALVSATATPDPTDLTGRWVAPRVVPLRPLPRPVSLAAMKAEPRLAQMAMFRQFRLSVTPVTPAERAVIVELADER